MCSYIILAAKHLSSISTLIILAFAVFLVLPVSAGICLEIQLLIEKHRERLERKSREEAREAAFNDFTKSEMFSPDETAKQTKAEIKEKFKFEPNVRIQKYKHCFYMINKNDFTYIEKPNYTPKCSVKNCPHKRKPRCEIHKILDFDFIRFTR